MGRQSASGERAMEDAMSNVDEDGVGGLGGHRGHRLDHIFDLLDGDGVLSLQNKKLCQRRFSGNEDRSCHDLDEVLLTGERRRHGERQSCSRSSLRRFDTWQGPACHIAGWTVLQP